MRPLRMGSSAVIHGLHHRVEHGYTLEYAGQRVQPHGTGYAFGWGFLRGGDFFHPGSGGLFHHGGLHGLQVHRGGDVIQGEVGLGLLPQADGFQDAAGLVVGDDARSSLHRQNEALGYPALFGHLLGGHFLTDALGTD